jgi:hypothetical protein
MGADPARVLARMKRWLAMDAWLYRRRGAGKRPHPSYPCGLEVEGFAEDWAVTTRQVMRDLAAFKQLGQRIEVVRPMREGGPPEYNPFPHRDRAGKLRRRRETIELRTFAHYYAEGVLPLFASNRDEAGQLAAIGAWQG